MILVARQLLNALTYWLTARRARKEIEHAQLDILTEDFRCIECNRLLFKATSQPFEPGGVVEITCGRCHAPNVFGGRPVGELTR